MKAFSCSMLPAILPAMLAVAVIGGCDKDSGGGDAAVDDCLDDTDGDGLIDCDEIDGFGTDPELADTDGDGLSDGDEVYTHGSDPLSADSDGDGTDDGAEVDCGSDPADSAEACYACGWGRDDPGDLVATGASEGDVIENLAMIDQCGDEVDLWDLAGEYHILFLTASW